MSDEKRPARFWQEKANRVIVDPDGWRVADAPGKDTPITYEEFLRRANQSTTAPYDGKMVGVFGEPEFTEAEIASAKRYIDSGEYDGAVTDPITYLLAERANEDRLQPPYPDGLISVPVLGDVEPMPDPAEMLVHGMLAPRTEEEAEIRRASRDVGDSVTLRGIVARFHRTEVEGLTEEEVRVLSNVAFRLGRKGTEVLAEATAKAHALNETQAEAEAWFRDHHPTTSSDIPEPAPLSIEERVVALEKAVDRLVQTAHRALDIASATSDWNPGR